MNTKAFSEYADKELLSIGNDELNNAIRVEAINREIAPPITLSDALHKSEYVGYQRPAEAVEIWEIQKQSRWGAHSNSGVAYLKKEDAERALIGMVSVEDAYGDTPAKILSSEPRIVCRLVTLMKADQKGVKFEEFVQDNTEFDKVVEECMGRVSAVRQAHYNQAVQQEKRAEYMRLANGDEAVAKNFWNKSERTEWPALQEQVAEPA
jgi:hypothetical protein